jgi:hypothetical protein
MKPHGNSLQNDELHHLYEIFDTVKGEVFKYGISAEPFGADGLSDRVREQLELCNLAADENRYTANILLRNIKGRKEAENLETRHILDFAEKHGRKPRGNRKAIKRRNRK